MIFVFIMVHTILVIVLRVRFWSLAFVILLYDMLIMPNNNRLRWLPTSKHNFSIFSHYDTIARP